MESHVHLMKARKETLIAITLATAILTVIVTLSRPLSYSATFRLLITQRAAFTLDPYTAVRSSELIGGNLAQVIGTSAFFDKVLKSGYNVNQAFFPTDEAKRRSTWTHMVDASVGRGTGLLVVKVYHPDRAQALQIASAVALLLGRDGADYVGRDIQVRLVDPPILSRFPVKPNLLGTTTAGLLLGFCLGNLYLYSSHRRRRHHHASLTSQT